jgi:hypothetical protein
MTHGKTPPPPAPAQSRPRASIDESRNSSRSDNRDNDDDNANKLPGGEDPRRPQYPGPMSTSENVTTKEQEAAQAARKDQDITQADVGPYATASRAEQVESQKAAAENPLGPASTSVSEPHTMQGAGLVAPPVPEGFDPGIPQGRGPQSQWKFDPMTGKPLAGGDRGSTTDSRRRKRLEDEDDDKVEVTLAGPVTFTDDRGGVHHYEAGKQKMPRAHAEHWYIRNHEAADDGDKKSRK